jgi:3-hydroxyacyl-CoA dehydrogenase
MDVKKIGILGVGAMGSGIAQLLATSGFDVIGRSRSEDSMKKAMNEIVDGMYGLKSAVKNGSITQEQMEKAISRIKLTTDMDEFCRDVDMVIECIPEDLKLKMIFFAELDRKCPPHCILATGSSGFSIVPIACATNRPERVVGTHWFWPPQINLGRNGIGAVEVIRGLDTSDETIETVKRVLEKCKKLPVVIKDQPMAYGYVANRCWMALVKEAVRIVMEGIATEEDVDNALKYGYGFLTGPFEMARVLPGEPKRLRRILGFLSSNPK